jgi:hypothetical protein
MAQRFQVTRVCEQSQEQVRYPSEIIPLINIEKESTSPPAAVVPVSLTLINETCKTSTRLLNSFLQRLKPHSLSSESALKLGESWTSSLRTHVTSDVPLTDEHDKTDGYYSTLHSNAFDTNSLRLTNQFLHELRLKRREIHEKRSHLSIDQRIALNRQRNHREITRAQDIFDVHFELYENENIQVHMFTEDAQETIRKNIFTELDRQRMKQYHKQHRHLLLARTLLIFITSLFVFMSVTLIYVVIDIYDRANYIDSALLENRWLSMIDHESIDIQR